LTVDGFAKRYGPWALIAGAAEGIGEAFARELARRGLNLLLVARRPEPLEAAAREIARFAKVEVRCISLDLTRADAAAALEQEVAGLDVGLVVYNAALAPAGTFLEIPLDEQLASIDVNVRGPLSVAHGFGQRMAARGAGGIVLLVADRLPGLPLGGDLRRLQIVLARAGRGPVARAGAPRCRRARGLRRRHAHPELHGARSRPRAG
jgi:NAD(P)-dependent dehydrogenase (short-subunit alcohol dehydrogenase family)